MDEVKTPGRAGPGRRTGSPSADGLPGVRGDTLASDRRHRRGLLDRSESEDLDLTPEQLLEEVRGMRRALQTRSAIDRAVGMLMERLGCDADDAFATLAEISQHTNRKLYLIASDIVDAPAAAAAHPGATPPETTPAVRLVTIRLMGEIDMSNAADLRRRLAPVKGQDTGLVVVDLGDVTFMDCAGLRPLLEARARLGRRLHLRNVPAGVRRMLVLSGTAKELLH